MRKIFMMMAVALTTCLISCSQKEAQPQQTEETPTEQDATTSATPKATDTMSPEDFVAYLESCGKYFLATMDGDQPRVRPFSFCDVINGEVYFMTRKHKDVYKQLVKNPKVQIAAFPNEGRGSKDVAGCVSPANWWKLKPPRFALISLTNTPA